jgi:hypothetical protein
LTSDGSENSLPVRHASLPRGCCRRLVAAGCRQTFLTGHRAGCIRDRRRALRAGETPWVSRGSTDSTAAPEIRHTLDTGPDLCRVGFSLFHISVPGAPRDEAEDDGVEICRHLVRSCWQQEAILSVRSASLLRTSSAFVRVAYIASFRVSAGRWREGSTRVVARAPRPARSTCCSRHRHSRRR